MSYGRTGMLPCRLRIGNVLGHAYALKKPADPWYWGVLQALSMTLQQ